MSQSVRPSLNEKYKAVEHILSGNIVSELTVGEIQRSESVDGGDFDGKSHKNRLNRNATFGF